MKDCTGNIYKHVDYFSKYGRIMQFNKNKAEPVHRWYPFVEGYSREFIHSILEEMPVGELVCMDPFSGSGTTPLELQEHGLLCYSFEVNPLMYLISRVKLENQYDISRIRYWHDVVRNMRDDMLVDLHSEFSTLYEGDGKERWNFSMDAAMAVQKLLNAIALINEPIYQELFTVALSAILLDVSNLYRNGKCLSYKKDWRERTVTQEDVFHKFDEKMRNEIIWDISNSVRDRNLVDNKCHLFKMDARIGIESEIADGSIDLVITSPPYLNSRDYTDTYMLELKTLGFTDTAMKVRELREHTVRSHVQIRWKDDSYVDNALLLDTLERIAGAPGAETRWNDSIIDMVRLYFVDMEKIFHALYKKVKEHGYVYFNVSNSAYFNVLVDTLEICASIAEQEGFKVLEIRDARMLKASPQQQKRVGKLLEGVIVLEK